jgi:uncharacterized integral membrane protein
MKGIKLILFFLAVIIVFILLWQNVPPLLENKITLGFRIGDPVGVDLATRPIPVLFLIPLFFFAGLVIMYLANWGSLFRLRRQVRRLEKELQGLRPPATELYAAASSQTSLPDQGEPEADR